MPSMCANIAWICGLTTNSNASFCFHHTQFLDFGFFRSEDYRSSYPKVLLKQLPLGKDVLKICSKFTAEHLFFLITKAKKKKNYSCLRKCGWREKSSPGRPQIYFFKLIFRRYSVFFFSSFCFFGFLFFLLLFVYCFFKLKMYNLIHIRLSGRVSDKNIVTRLISGNKITFFSEKCYYLFISLQLFFNVRF